MKQQLLDDLQHYEGKAKLRNTLLENIESAAMVAAALCIIMDIYNLINFGFYIWMLLGPAIIALVVGFIIFWKKESIAFDSNPTKNRFIIPDNLKVLQFIAGLLLLWEAYNNAFSLWYLIHDLMSGTGVLNILLWGIQLIIGISFTGLSLFYLYLTDKAVKYVNRL